MDHDTQTETEDDYSDVAATFGDRVTAARTALGMTQSQLARRLGIKHETLVKWEDDRSEPRANRLQMLAGILNVSIIWLMSGTGEGGPNYEQDNDEPLMLEEILTEMRTIREIQLTLHARLGKLEKQLRGAMG